MNSSCPNAATSGFTASGAISRTREIRTVDIEVAFLHKTLFKPEEFRALNFHLHVPGHVATKRVDPAMFDKTRVAIALEYQNSGMETQLDALRAQFGGRLP